jgi:DNA repair protein RadD
MKVFEERWYQAEPIERLFEYYGVPRPLDDKGNPVQKNPLICLPTGTGKSVVIAKFIQRCFELVPNTRVIMATHVKELIKQNAQKLLEVWPLAPVGIFSAGLNQRDYYQPIIFGGIQSMAGKLIFGKVDFLIIDEAHLLGDEGRYIQFINELRLRNPFLKVIGLTATPYRMGLGLMTNGSIFTDIVYNQCNLEGFGRLIAEGYICPLIIPSRLAVQLDVSGVGFSKGEYKQGELEEAVDKSDVNQAALSQYLQYSEDRRSGIVFASGVKHAEHIWEMINDVFNVPAVILHSKRTDKQNDKALENWKLGRVKHAVNMNMLTTGVDSPMLDICADLQPTMSTGKHVQKYGRLTRPFKENGYIKYNGLILDFAGNTRRLGPINDPLIPRKKGESGGGPAPTRICPNCGVYNHATFRQCIACGLEFDFSPILTTEASRAEVMKSELPLVEDIKVNRVVYTAHTSKTGNKSIKISYYCGLRTFYDWKSVEGPKQFTKHQGRDWFRQIYGEPPEHLTNADVLNLVSYLRAPKTIKVWLNRNPHPQVLSQEF